MDAVAKRRSISLSPTRIHSVRYPSLSAPTPFRNASAEREPLTKYYESNYLLAHIDVTSPKISFSSTDSLPEFTNVKVASLIQQDSIQSEAAEPLEADRQGELQPELDPQYHARDRISQHIRLEARLVTRGVSEKDIEHAISYERASTDYKELRLSTRKKRKKKWNFIFIPAKN